MQTPTAGAGIVLCAHGSRDPAWCGPIEAVAGHIRQLAPGTPVVCAYLEHSAPNLDAAITHLLTEGARSITVWPMFLGAGRHARDDLPRLVTALQQRYPGLTIDLRPAITEHPGVLHAMAVATLDGRGLLDQNRHNDGATYSKIP